MINEKTKGTRSKEHHRELEELRDRVKKYELGWPPGHFYSPIPDLHAVASNEQRIFPEQLPDSLPSIDLAPDCQRQWLEKVEALYPSQPFTDTATSERRYGFENDYFGHGEALTLFGMMQTIKPKRIIEIGAGYSTAAMLDIDELFFDGKIEFKIVEPYPDRLLKLLRDRDFQHIDLQERPVQEIETQEFSSLEPGDMLFVDSSHVSKVDSDLNHLLFRILPALQDGVVIHFHDIYYPFEYPSSWVYEGRAWTECYLLRAFLQYNDAFRVLFYNSYIAHKYADRIAKNMPLFAKSAGSSLWMEKLAKPCAFPRETLQD